MLAGSLSPNPSLSGRPPLHGKNICSKGRLTRGFSHSNQQPRGREWHQLPDTPSSVAASTGQAQAAGTEAALGLLSADGEEVSSTEANRCWELQRCGDHRADFYQDIFKELQSRPLEKCSLHQHEMPGGSRTQRCPTPGAVPCGLPTAARSEYPIPRCPLAQCLPLQTKPR